MQIVSVFLWCCMRCFLLLCDNQKVGERNRGKTKAAASSAKIEGKKKPLRLSLAGFTAAQPTDSSCHTPVTLFCSVTCHSWQLSAFSCQRVRVKKKNHQFQWKDCRIHLWSSLCFESDQIISFQLSITVKVGMQSFVSWLGGARHNRTALVDVLYSDILFCSSDRADNTTICSPPPLLSAERLQRAEKNNFLPIQ